MEHIIKLYSYVNGINDIPFPSETEQVMITSFKYEANRMAGAPIITATIKHRLCLDNLWTDNVYGTFNGEKYFIRSVPSSSKSNDDTRYEHNIELLSEREILNHVYFIDAVQGDSSTDVYKTNTTKFQFMGNIHEFANRLNASLQYSNLDYSVIVDSGISSEDKLVSFEDKYILEAMQEIFNTYEIPYYFVGKVIHIGYTENAITHVFKYGHDEALLKISKDNANYQVINRITGIGSSDNIPYYYPNESDDRAAIIASGKKWITPSQNLMPPIYRETNGAERFYNAKNNTYSDEEGGYYHFNNEYTPNNPLEGKQTFEDIKPTIKGMTNANGERIDMFLEFAYDEDDSDEIDEEGNYLHPYFFAKLRKTDGANGFNLFEHAIESQAMQISMTSGDCGACTFEIGVGEDTQQNIVQVDENGDLLRDEDGNVVRSGTPQPQQNNTENYEVWLALKKDDSTYSTLMPDASFNMRPSTDDTFVILGISLPQGYITRAEEELMKSMIKYMYMNNDEKFTFSIGFSRIFFTEHPEILSQLNENSRLIIEYNGKQHTLYVNSFNYTMSDSQSLPEIQIDLVDTLTIGQNSLQTALDSVKQDILTSIGGGDFLQNGLRYFLRKDVQDTAREKITFRKGLDVGNFSSNVSGGTFREDENGDSYVETDTLFVRKKAIFQEYQIRKVSYIGGEYICSAASMDRIFRVEEYDTFYRCYANDGSSSYENEFVAGDQVICRMSDLAQEHVVNRYYWRYVMAVGSNYIDLSKSDADTNSDIPLEGDILVQLGNRNDKTRQNAIIISSVSVDAPSIKLLRAINSYSLDNKDDMSQGFDTSTGRGFLKIIGDFFAGAADNSTYVKYDAGRKVLEIKGKFLTGTGDSIEDIINNIQNQVNGAIETWFYDPEPTLDNEPAVNWITENDKNNHLGDLYYSGEGKAYRFQKDGDNYIWKLIQDTDITKALEAANQARQEAEAARQEAEAATDRLNKWAADGVISPTEKQSIKDEIARIDADHTHINSEYTKYALGTPDAFNSAYTAYRAILVTLSADTPETIDIPNDFAAKQNKYYTERINALDSISSKSVQLIEDAKAAADAAKDAADKAQDTADGLKNFTDKAFADGIVDRAEAAAIEKYLNTVKETQQSVNGTYNTLYSNAYLLNEDGSDIDEKKALKSAYDTLTASINNLINKINSAIQDGIATSDEKAAVDTAYTTFNSNLNSYNVAVENANKAIQDRLKGYSDEYAYLKKAFENDTSIEGGVVATSLVQLGFKDSTGKYNIKSGINGIYDDEVLGNGISYWAGGLPIDREMYEEGSVPSNAATALIRMDGTGYLAGGNISWDANGKITTNKGAFYFGDELIDRYLDLFTLHVVNGNIDYITPNHPFSSLDVNTRIRIGNAYLEWDEENNGVKVMGIHGEEVGLYALGYISSMGLSDTSGSGGLFDLLQDWDMYDSATAKSIALSAFLGKDLLDRITTLENGKKGHTIVVSGTGNVVTNVVESGNTLTFTKGNIDTSVTIDKITDLHSSWDSLLKAQKPSTLSGYGITDGVNNVNVIGIGNVVTAASISGHTLTLTKGITALTSVSLATITDLHSSWDALLKNAPSAQVTRWPTISEVTNKYDLVIKLNGGTTEGTNQITYNVTTAKTVNITTANIGADAKFVTALGTSGNYLTWTRNGTTNNITVPYSSNADKLDGLHESSFVRISGRDTIYTSDQAPYAYIHLFRIANKDSYSTKRIDVDIKTRYHAAVLHIDIQANQYPYGSGASSITISKETCNGRSGRFYYKRTEQSSGYNYYDIYYQCGIWNSGSYGVIFEGSNGRLVYEPKGTNIAALPDGCTEIAETSYPGNAASATKLQTARTLWGQSFDGTANVSGNMSGVGGIDFTETNAVSIDAYGNIILNTGTSWSISKDNNYAICVRNSSLNVGIGTSSPSYKLHVNGTGYFGGQLNLGNNQILYATMASNDYWRIVGSGSSDSGSVAFETGDNGNEAIYFRQYNASGVAHSITLMDGSGNQSFLAVTASGMITANGGITVPSSKTIKLGNGTISWDSENNCFHFSHGLYSNEFVSALGLSDTAGGGGGDYNRLDDWSDYDSSKSTWALSAKLGYELYEDVTSLKNGSALNFTTTGSGNVVSAITKSGTTVTVNKGITALTSHQSIYSLTIQGNGTTIGTFNPKSAAATINITPTNIGAPTKTGSGANGTWGISISGTAAKATALATARTINDVAFNGTANIQLTGMYAESLEGKTLSLNTLTLSGGTPRVKWYRCLTDGGGNGITGRPDDSSKQAFSLRCEVIRWASATDYITKQVYTQGAKKQSWTRYIVNGTASAWNKPLDSANYTEYTVTKTGGGASGTWGIGISGNAATASKWATKRTLSLTGAVTGSVSLDGSGNVSLATTYATGNIAALDSRYLLKSAYTAADVLAKLKTVDGSGSGLDADTLDGRHYTSFPLRIGGSLYTTADNPSVKLLTFTRGRDKGWFRISISDSNNATQGVAALYVVKWGYTSSTDTSTYSVSIACIYSTGANVSNKLIVVRTSGATFDLYYTPNNTASEVGCVLEGYGGTCTINNYNTAVTTTPTATYTSAQATLFTNISGSLSGNASTATKLQTARQINGTNFDGSANITTAKWGTSRSIYIRDASQAHTGAAVSVDGSANEYLLLPATITATLSGNASSASKLQTARTLWGQSFNGTANVSGSMTGVGGISMSGAITQQNGENHFAYGTYSDPASGVTCAIKVSGKMAVSDNFIYPHGGVLAKYTIDATSLDQNTWYPVTISIQTFNTTHIEVHANLNVTNSGVPSWCTHDSGFSVDLVWETNGSAWGITSINRRVLRSSFNWCNEPPVCGIGQMQNSSNEYVYVRGGGRYDFYVSHKAAPTLRTSAYTVREQTIEPIKTQPKEITPWSVSDNNQTSPAIILELAKNGMLHSTVGIYSDGAVTALSTSSSSDIRLKDVINDVALTTEQIAEAPAVVFKWKKNGNKAVGTIAQYWQKVIPEAVEESPNGYLSMQYGVAAMLAVISNARRILSVEERIKQLEDEIISLKAGLSS